MITQGSPPSSVVIDVDILTVPPVIDDSSFEVVPFTEAHPIQIVGFVPLDILCCEAPPEYIRRMDVPIFIWSYTVNGQTTNVTNEFGTLAEQDEFFYNLGWAKTDNWYYIITEDTWVWNLSYGVVPAIDYPVSVALPCPSECREWCDTNYVHPVFGSPNSTDPYNNDFNSWLIKMPVRRTFEGYDDVHFILQKNNGDWTDLSVLNDDTLGIYYPTNTNGHNYIGYCINWGLVYQRFGSGCYRIKLQHTFIRAGEEITVDTFSTTPLPVRNPDLGIDFTLIKETPKLITLTSRDPTVIMGGLNNSAPMVEAGVTFEVAKEMDESLTIDITGRTSNRVDMVSIYPPVLNGSVPAPIPATYEGSYTYTQDTLYYQCYASEVFDLKGFDCELADGTVKFENWLKGKIGDKRTDYLLFDLCDMWWYDSIRVRGIFGYPTVPEYKTVMLEWGNPNHGKQERIRDEAIQSFEFKSMPLPQSLHERLSIYAMMADELVVSDYNLVSSDWDIKRLKVVRDSGYEAKPFTKEGSRKAVVELNFKRGVQGVIKSICC